ncbi:MAG: hypothetical protein J6Y37_14395 [Paludibacteraceae bacterium]|nr:hypothetical protein [Paludibacteraceae bacterium]
MISTAVACSLCMEGRFSTEALIRVFFIGVLLCINGVLMCLVLSPRVVKKDVHGRRREKCEFMTAPVGTLGENIDTIAFKPTHCGE